MAVTDINKINVETTDIHLIECIERTHIERLKKETKQAKVRMNDYVNLKFFKQD